jgi:DNA-binding winged helix-turn-helix (wHTH) protein/Tol biopolymer transport system component
MAPSGQVAYRFNGFRVDPVRRLLFGADGEPIPLKPKVFDVLLYLVERSGELVDKRALLEAVWPHVVVEENNLNKAISTLRQAFGESPDEHRFIVTEPGRGFRFVASIETVTPAAAPAVSETRLPPGKEASGSSNGLRYIAAAAIAVVVGVTGWFLRPVPAPEPKTVVRFSVPLPAEPSYPANNQSIIAVSPDGQQIAYVANRQLWLRNIGEPDAHAVPGTAVASGGLVTPVFSPDGQWLAYVEVEVISNGTGAVLRRVPISGGTPALVHEAGRTADALGLSWPTADTILLAHVDGIVRIPASGGTPEMLVARGEGERFNSPQLLPGGEAVLFTRVPGDPGPFGGFDAAQIVVQSIGRADRTVVVEGGSAARYLPTGHLVYARGTALFAIPFDPETRAVRGGPVQIVDALRRSANGISDTAYLDVSKTGTLVTVPSNPSVGRTTLAWVDREGREEPFPVRADHYTMVRISRDGTKVALVLGSIIGSPRPAIWLFDQRTENLGLLTGDPAGDDGPVWSADGRRIFFRSLRGGFPGVYVIELETGETKLLASSSPEFPFLLPWTISPDDRTLGLATFRGGIDSATLSIADGALALLLHEPEIVEADWSISPNGTWIAYQEGADDSGGEINFRPFPAVSRTRIRLGRGNALVFSRDGSELFFFDGQGLSAAPVTYEPTLRVGAPQRLFETTARFPSVPGGRSWDVDPSGKRFLMVRAPSAAAGGTEPRIDVVVNWFEELKSRVPTL